MNGVLRYTKARIEYEFSYPENETTCYGCRYCSKDAVGRERCKITDEILLHIRTERGHKCPAVILDIIGEEE